MLSRLDLDKISYELRDKTNNDTSQQRKTEALKRLQVEKLFVRQSNATNQNGWS